MGTRWSLAINYAMYAQKIRTVSATLIAAFTLACAACSSDGGGGPAGSGGTSPGAGGQSGSSGGSVGTGGGGTVGSGGSVGGSGSGGAVGAGGAASGGATGGSGSPAHGGAAGSLGGGSAGVGGERTGGTGAGGSAGKAGSGGAGGMTAGAGPGAGGTAGRAGSGGAAGSSSGGSGGGASSYQPCPASGACKIMPFGDSITQGFNVNGGYRAPLFHLALAGNRNITFVGGQSDYSVPSVDGMTFPKNHEGHGGYTIEGSNGIAQYVTSRMPNYKPNIITLMIGTNDINGNVSVSDAPNRLGKLLDAIFAQDANVLVVLAQIVPTRTDGTNNTIKTYNAAMPNLVSTRVSQGRHIVLVDMYGAFTKDANYKNSLMGDNLHPSQAGYNLMADVWFQALNPYLK